MHQQASLSFQLMLSENSRVRAKIQSVFEQLAMPHVAKVRCCHQIRLLAHILCAVYQDSNTTSVKIILALHMLKPGDLK